MPVEQVVTTDTLELPPVASRKIIQLSVAGLIGRIIEAEIADNQGAYGLIADLNSDAEFESE